MNRRGTLRLGTRGSRLARWQAEWVAGQLRRLEVDVEVVLIQTQGDVTSGPLGSVGGEGLFTKEIQRALLADDIDLAVHSLKDLPTQSIPGLVVAAVPPRENPQDVLVSRRYGQIEALPPAARVGTSSPRRRAQLLHNHPALEVRDIRGNVETRLSKLDEGHYDAILLAAAGLKRLNLESRMGQLLPLDVMLPAVGQAALGLETRQDDMRTREIVAQLDDPSSHSAVVAERSLLAALRAGCLAPVGAWGRVADSGQALELDAAVLSADGRQRLFVHVAGPPDAPQNLGRLAAEQLLADGADRLIHSARS